MTPSRTPIPSDVTEQIARIILVLCETVTMRCNLHVRTLTVAQVEYICWPLLAARKRFRSLVALIRAGKPPKERARKPKKPRPVKPRRETLAELEREFGASLPRGWRRRAREDRARARAAEKAARALAAASKPVPMWLALRMHMRGWLYGVAPTVFGVPHGAASCARELRRLLADQEVQALLRQSRYLGDTLRRLCWGLDIEFSLIYPEPEVAEAPVEAEPASATPAEIVVSGPSAVVTAAPDEKTHFPWAAAMPPSPTGASEMASFPQTSGAPAKDEFFARE